MVWTMLMMAAAAQVAGVDPALQRRIALARQYEALTHREQRTTDIAVRQLTLAWQPIANCRDPACTTALGRDIGQAVQAAEPALEQATTALMAAHLTEEQLQAAIAFTRSPEGQAIVAAEDEIGGDVAEIGHRFATAVNTSVFRAFCVDGGRPCTRGTARPPTQDAPRP